jgi:hypothetical protein
MALPFAPDAASVPLHRLFPEEYRATRRQIVRDFAFFGLCIVGFVLSLVLAFG